MLIAFLIIGTSVFGGEKYSVKNSVYNGGEMPRLGITQGNSLLPIRNAFNQSEMYVLGALEGKSVSGSLLGSPAVRNDYMRIITALNVCENSGQWNERKILDTNNRYSYGGLMFQLSTFLSYGKKYHILPEWITPEDAEKIIYDKQLQITIASNMLADGEWWNWRNCYLKSI